MTTYLFTPKSVASCLDVQIDGGAAVTCIYMSKSAGIETNLRGRKLDEETWPAEVKANVRAYFDKVFALAHENWDYKQGPSPRATYVDAAKPWSLTLDDAKGPVVWKPAGSNVCVTLGPDCYIDARCDIRSPDYSMLEFVQGGQVKQYLTVKDKHAPEVIMQMVRAKGPLPMYTTEERDYYA